ncbi:MAG: SufE family protein [Gemmatimonadota bacterium]|nr:SufE family protein [Gemmatimonadota bacterium]
MPADTQQLPPSIARVLERFRTLPREDKMQLLVQYSRKLEPLPERFRALDRAAFTVPECQTRVDIFSDVRDGMVHYYADLDARQSPTIAAFLAIVFSAVNDHPPATTLAIPTDFVPQVMANIGLAAREVGLTAIVARLKRYAGEAAAEVGGEGGNGKWGRGLSSTHKHE